MWGKGECWVVGYKRCTLGNEENVHGEELWQVRRGGRGARSFSEGN